MKQYSADVFVNGEWCYGFYGGSKKGAVESANQVADMFKRDEAKTAELLKIRNLTRIEVTIGRKQYRQKIRS